MTTKPIKDEAPDVRLSRDELYRLLTDTIGLYDEYQTAHGYDPEHAAGAAIAEVLESLDLELPEVTQ